MLASLAEMFVVGQGVEDMGKTARNLEERLYCSLVYVKLPRKHNSRKMQSAKSRLSW